VIENDDRDSVREYTEEAQHRLTDQLWSLTARVADGAFKGTPFSLALIQDFHRSLFDGVRGHAGRIRRPGFGSEHLIFGPQRSVHRDKVEGELAAVVTRVERDLRPLLGDGAAEDYEVRAIELAVWAHAEVIRIHPFEDGNGRTSRLCAGHLLVQCGLWSVPIEAVKQEYTTALNHYYKTREITPLVDLFIELYPAGR
jgi:Fic family protein